MAYLGSFILLFGFEVYGEAGPKGPTPPNPSLFAFSVFCFSFFVCLFVCLFSFYFSFWATSLDPKLSLALFFVCSVVFLHVFVSSLFCLFV